jgi:hypothetical protein
MNLPKSWHDQITIGTRDPRGHLGLPERPADSMMREELAHDRHRLSLGKSSTKIIGNARRAA